MRLFKKELVLVSALGVGCHGVPVGKQGMFTDTSDYKEGEELINQQPSLKPIKKSRQLDTQELIGELAKTRQAIDNLKRVPVFAVLGNTGAGKSTTIAALQGHEMVRKYDEKSGLPYVTTAHAMGPAIADIGKLFSSETRYPSLYAPLSKQGYKGLWYLDTPGFDDTGSEAVKVARSIGINMALSRQDVRGVLVVLDSNKLAGVGKGKGIKEMFGIIHRMVGDVRPLMDHFFFCFNKVNEFQQLQHVRYQLGLLAKGQDVEAAGVARCLLDSKNLFLVKPLDKGVTAGAINQAIYLKSSYMPKGVFRYAADRWTMGQLGGFVQETSRVNVEAKLALEEVGLLANYKQRDLEKLKEDYKKAQASYQVLDRQGLKFVANRKCLRGGWPEIMDHLEGQKERLATKKNKLLQSRQLVPYKGVLKKYETIKVPEIRYKLVDTLVTKPMPFFLFEAEASLWAFLNPPRKVEKRVPYTKMIPREVPYKVEEPLLYFSDEDEKEAPENKKYERIIKIEKNKHPVVKQKIETLARQIAILGREITKCQYNHKLNQQCEDFTKRIKVYEQEILVLKNKISGHNKTLLTYKPHVSAVHTLGEVVDLKGDVGTFGAHVGPFFKHFPK